MMSRSIEALLDAGTGDDWSLLHWLLCTVGSSSPAQPVKFLHLDAAHGEQRGPCVVSICLVTQEACHRNRGNHVKVADTLSPRGSISQQPSP